MNKLFLIVLALCLISVNCLVVKREAETPSPNLFESAQKSIQDFSKSFGDQLSKAFDPEQIKKSVNDAIDNISKMVDSAKQEQQKQ